MLFAVSSESTRISFLYAPTWHDCPVWITETPGDPSTTGPPDASSCRQRMELSAVTTPAYALTIPAGAEYVRVRVQARVSLSAYDGDGCAAYDPSQVVSGGCVRDGPDGQQHPPTGDIAVGGAPAAIAGLRMVKGTTNYPWPAKDTNHFWGVSEAPLYDGYVQRATTLDVGSPPFNTRADEFFLPDELAELWFSWIGDTFFFEGEAVVTVIGYTDNGLTGVGSRIRDLDRYTSSTSFLAVDGAEYGCGGLAVDDPPDATFTVATCIDEMRDPATITVTLPMSLVPEAAQSATHFRMLIESYDYSAGVFTVGCYTPRRLLPGDIRVWFCMGPLGTLPLPGHIDPTEWTFRQIGGTQPLVEPDGLTGNPPQEYEFAHLVGGPGIDAPIYNQYGAPVDFDPQSFFAFDTAGGDVEVGLTFEGRWGGTEIIRLGIRLELYELLGPPLPPPPDEGPASGLINLATVRRGVLHKQARR